MTTKVLFLIKSVALSIAVLIMCILLIWSINIRTAEPPIGKQVSSEYKLAEHIIDMGGISHGLCSVLSCDDVKLAIEIARLNDLIIHIQDTDIVEVDNAKKIVNDEDLYGKRIIIEKGSLNRLPYAENTIDLVITTHLTKDSLNELSMSEILRVLRPRGKAIIGSNIKRENSEHTLTVKQLENWMQKEPVKNFELVDDNHGIWLLVTKPYLPGVDNWSHWGHAPDNNPVSNDTVIKSPYMTQWLGRPYYLAMPAITTVAGGRTFLAMGHIAHHEREEKWLNTLVARNGYNGIELWTRKLPDGYLVHRSAFIATDDNFYMIDTDGNGCLVLDPETGIEKNRISVPGLTGDWKWIAIDNGMLYVLVGKEKDPSETTIVRSQSTQWSWADLSQGYYENPLSWGFGTTILAYDINEKRVVWIHEEASPLDSRAMVIGDNKLFFYGPEARLGCLDSRSGDVIWTNSDPNIRELIEEFARGVKGPTGIRTTCYCLYSPEALFYGAQAGMNIVAVSPRNGNLLWTMPKTSSTADMIYVDDHLIVGIGPPDSGAGSGRTLVIDPRTGETVEDLGFMKHGCARLTASWDSFFFRGWPEGLSRYDRISKKVTYNPAIRPSCTDGALPANGMLYVGPWLCDCNLSLMGVAGMCSAGDFTFAVAGAEEERLEKNSETFSLSTNLEVTEKDWPTYRGNNDRSASSSSVVPEEVEKVWEYTPKSPYLPTTPTAAGGLIFIGGDDCIVRAIDAARGTIKWQYLTAGPIMQPPTIWNGRAYFGSGDGYIYCVDASNGSLLWRFRAAPVERHIMVYGKLSSTWPVNSGVLVENGIVYAAAGIIDYDGTYVYALDALTGRILWQNTTSGHLDREARKGVSAQGMLTIADDRLWLAGGNVVNPASYDLKTGTYVGPMPGPVPVTHGQQANRGEEIGIFNNKHLVFGGRLRYSATENVVNPGIFAGVPINTNNGAGIQKTINRGKIPPAWDDNRIILINGRYTMPECFRTDSIDKYLISDSNVRMPSPLWTADNLKECDVISMIITQNAILAVYQFNGYFADRNNRTKGTNWERNRLRWSVCALNLDNGEMIWQHELSSVEMIGERPYVKATPLLPGGLLVDRSGHVVVVEENGGIVCFGM